MCCGQSRRQYQAGKTSSRINQQRTVARKPAPPAMGSSSAPYSQNLSSTAHNYNSQHNLTNAHTGSNEVMLHYLQTTSILVNGSVSGRHYKFSGEAPNQPVDARDIESLLKTGFFRKGFG